MEFRTFTTMGELLRYFCSPVLWVTYLAGMGFDFMVIVPLLPSLSGFFLSLDMGYIFWWVLALSIDGCSTASCDFGALAGGDVHMSYYAMLNWRPIFWLFLMSPF